MKDKGLKNRNVKFKREIEELFFKPIAVSIDNMDKFEENEMQKIRPIKNTWFNWLINYIPESITKIASGFKDRLVNLFHTNTPKQTVYRGRRKTKQTKTKTKTI